MFITKRIIILYLPICLYDHPSQYQNQKEPVDTPKSHKLEEMVSFCENVPKIWKYHYKVFFGTTFSPGK